jgi:hypothetical protein
MSAFVWLVVMCSILWVFVFSKRARRIFGKVFTVKNQNKEDQDTNNAVSLAMTIVSAMFLSIILLYGVITYIIRELQ